MGRTELAFIETSVRPSPAMPSSPLASGCPAEEQPSPKLLIASKIPSLPL